MNAAGVRGSQVPPGLCGQVEAGGGRAQPGVGAIQASVGLERAKAHL